MGIVHLTAEELSALIDGELSPQGELRARQHLAECGPCSAEYALSVRLDEELRQPPVLACDEVLEVLSAGLHREGGGGEETRAGGHPPGRPDRRAGAGTWGRAPAGVQ